ncbi:MAG: DUF4890 domain-containing protein [Prevotella sp.]|uniref:DUF4890 domain-containing protein n=1 Tax=Prevotella sp. TaxID=59823 RepID=UPI002A2819F3|nr:DUF4890 domain-containing protein [Prevotella sp.]MDD7318898.1 DUF4890 domain-containing protein [Prevotellaceae bacterium]MDY4019277.1 DUF4890 domain-containing protein [Prevotella sp.]
MKRFFLVMVATVMAISYATAQCAQTENKEACKSSCEQRKQCDKQENAADKGCKCDNCKCGKGEDKCSGNCDKQPRKCTNKTDIMIKNLELTPEQAEKIKALAEKYPELASKRCGKCHNGNMDCGSKSSSECDKQGAEKQCTAEKKCPNAKSKEDVEALHKKRAEYDAELKSILNAEQYAKYENCKKQSKCKHKK